KRASLFPAGMKCSDECHNGLWIPLHLLRDQVATAQKFHSPCTILWTWYRLSRADELLRPNRKFCQSFHARPVFPQGVFHYAKIEARNDDVVPAIANSTQRHIQHGHDLPAQRFVTVESDGPKEFLAFGIARVVRSRVGLLLGEIDVLANAPGDFLRAASEEID